MPRITPQQYVTIHTLAREGFAVTNLYGDGVLRMERPRCWQVRVEETTRRYEEAMR